MTNLMDDFRSFLHLTEVLNNYIVRFYDYDGYAKGYVILGSTQMPDGDLLLHLGEAPIAALLDDSELTSWDEIFAKAEKNLQFRLLSTLVNHEYGFEVLEIDQLDDADIEDDSGLAEPALAEEEEQLTLDQAVGGSGRRATASLAASKD